MRSAERAKADPGNSWAWYEVCKEGGARDPLTLVGLTGLFPLPAAALEGLDEYLSMEHNRA